MLLIIFCTHKFDGTWGLTFLRVINVEPQSLLQMAWAED